MEAYGRTSNNNTSEGEVPLLDISLFEYGCDLIEGRRYYRMTVQVRVPDGVTFLWRVQRRLCKLRAGLHDVVKACLGDDAYGQHFHPEWRFPSHGSVPGTTERLKAWLKRLAQLISEKKVPEDVVARTLAFFVAPSFAPLELLKLATPWAYLVEEETLTLATYWLGSPIIGNPAGTCSFSPDSPNGSLEDARNEDYRIAMTTEELEDANLQRVRIQTAKLQRELYNLETVASFDQDFDPNGFAGSCDSGCVCGLHTDGCEYIDAR
jgi:hypothetical protein